MNDSETYVADTLSAINLDWQAKYINGIESNGIECWWTVGKLGALKRFYKVVPFNKCDERGLVISDGPRYFALYEALGLESEGASLIAIYESREQAKQRAKFQLLSIVNLIEHYCPSN